MKRELKIARCGLACCLCSENSHCSGCDSGKCDANAWCVNRKCSKAKSIKGCYECEKDCKECMLAKIKPYGFTLFVKRYGIEKILDCLERNEKQGVVYHRKGVLGDYDDFTDVEKLISFILNGA